MKRKGLLLAVLILAAVCVCCAALADDYPVNPYQEEVWEFDRMSNLVGKTRDVSYSYNGKITIEELQAPAIGQAGSWRVNVQDGLTVTKRSISIQSPDPAGGYSTEYRIKNPTSDLIESCEFVAPGVYRVSAFYDFSDGTGSVAAYEIVIEEDGMHPTVAQKVNEILNDCRVAGDDWQTALNLHDWLTHHAYYDYSYSFYGAEDVLMRGYGVCDSYSKAYAYLLNAAGITQERATSKGHAWNVITLGGEEYHVDATWDDGGNAQVPVSGNESHRYFCLNDELIYGFMDQNDSHKEGAKLTGRCTSLAESYPIHTGEWRNYGGIYVNSYTTQNYQDQILEGATGTENPFIVYANDGFPAEEAGYFYDASTIPALYDRYFLAYGLTHAGLETADGTVLDVEVTYDTSDLFFTVSVLGVKPGKAAPVPTITMTGGRETTADGAVSFLITTEAPDNGDYSDVLYEIAPAGEGEGTAPAIAGVFAAGEEQTITMDQIRETGFYIAENIPFRLQVRAYGPGYESETAVSPKLYVTGARDEAFTITGSIMTGTDTAQMMTNRPNYVTVTAPEGVDSIEVCRGDNNWLSCSIDQWNWITLDPYATGITEAPLVARYTTGTGETRYSNVIFVDSWAPIMPETIIPGQDAVITFPKLEGATYYGLSVQLPAGIAYFATITEPGSIVIPAMVFADGYDDYIIPEVQQIIDGEYNELYWEPFEYNVAAYTGEQMLTIDAGEFSDGLQMISLSVADAEQVIIQEQTCNKQFDYTYWTTLCVKDNPGAAVNTELLVTNAHLIRAAVKKNGVWSAWSPVIEVNTPICGKCNDDISWTLTSDGKLTITGNGVIPYEMDDEWAEDFREAVTEVEIGNGITGIGSYVFSGHTNLTAVTIPASLKTIGEYAFGNCRKLTDILTPGGGDRTTYYRCYNGSEMRVFTLPSTVEELGLLVFDESGYGATARPDMEIPANTSRIEAYAFQDTNPTFVKMVTWNVNGIEIGDHAFADCDSLRYFLIYGDGGDFDLSIADQAFADCEGLVFIGIENEQLKQFAESHGFTYIENEEMGGNG